MLNIRHVREDEPVMSNSANRSRGMAGVKILTYIGSWGEEFATSESTRYQWSSAEMSRLRSKWQENFEGAGVGEGEGRRVSEYDLAAVHVTSERTLPS